LNDTIDRSIQGFYLKHKGILINLFSVCTFLGFDRTLGTRGINDLDKAPWLALLYLVVFLLEPWATRYSMGAFNQRREAADLDPILLHRWMHNGLLSLICWAGRIALFAVLFMACLEAIGLPDIFQVTFIAVVIFLSLMVREAFIVYYMSGKKPLPDFKESYDFAADIVLMLVLAFGQLVVAEVFRDMGIKGLDDPVDFFYYLFPIGLFFFVFYLPIRYIYTVEDFTFARSRWEKVEQVVSFLLVFVGFLIAG
jgi:hypothetical protein